MGYWILKFLQVLFFFKRLCGNWELYEGARGAGH